jgi:hypothetical protein
MLLIIPPMASVEQLMELESLGISPNRTNECNDENEISWLIELLKQDLYDLYKSIYNEDY